MNDFTKEELQYMAVCIKGEIKYYGADHVGHAAMDKIQSLIDNYCEHEPEGDFHVCVDKCKHCGVIVE